MITALTKWWNWATGILSSKSYGRNITLIEAKKQEYYREKKAELPMSLSTKKVLQLLKQEGILRMEEISSRLPNYTCRTLRNAIKELKQMDLLYSQPDIRDMRRRLYVYKKQQ